MHKSNSFFIITRGFIESYRSQWQPCGIFRSLVRLLLVWSFIFEYSKLLSLLSGTILKSSNLKPIGGSVLIRIQYEIKSFSCRKIRDPCEIAFTFFLKHEIPTWKRYDRIHLYGLKRFTVTGNGCQSVTFHRKNCRADRRHRINKSESVPLSFFNSESFHGRSRDKARCDILWQKLSF